MTYFCELDVLLGEQAGWGGAASAVHEPPSISNQNHIGSLYSLRHAAGQRVPHLVPQGSSVGVDLKTTTCNERDNEEHQRLKTWPQLRGRRRVGSRRFYGQSVVGGGVPGRTWQRFLSGDVATNQTVTPTSV